MPKQKTDFSQDLTVGSVPKLLLSFAAPLLLSALFQTAYNVVDAAVVGRTVGSSCLAGVSVGGDILHTLTFAAMGFSNAGQIMIAQLTGAGQREKVRKVIGTLFTFLFLCALVLMTGCLLFRENILRLMNVPMEAWDYALSYVTICFCGTIFIYGYNLVSAVLRGMGDSRHPFLFITFASVANIVLDLIFVLVFHWYASGVALATVVSQGASFLLAILFLYRKRDQFGFDFAPAHFRIHREVFVPLLLLGVPMVLQSAAINLSKLFVAANINAYGAIATAITGIGNKLDAAFVALTGALSTAGGSMIGQCIGGQKFERVPRILATSFFFTFVLCTAVCVLLVASPSALFGLFVTERETLEAAVVYVPVAIVCLYSCVARQPMMALIYGSGNSRMNLVVAVIDGIVARIGLSLLLGELLHWGIYGYWYGNALSGFAPFLIGAVYYLSGRWRKAAV